jgi:hypothetical protein
MAESPDGFARDLERAAAAAKPVVRRVVNRGAATIKAQARANAKSTARWHGRYAPMAINYDLDEGPSWVSADIGYDRDAGGNAGRQARLGGILEHGSPTSPAHRDIGRAFEDEVPKFERALADEIGKLL